MTGQPPPIPATAAGPRTPVALNVPPRQRYQLAARAPGIAWWRGLVALGLFAAAFALAQLILTGLLIAAALIADQPGWIGLDGGMSPALLLVTNLALAALIPASMLIERYVFKVPAGQIHSVAGRIRWRWLGLCALVAAPLWALWVGLGSGEVSWAGVSATVLAYTAITILTTPLQSAGEEYGFRGLIMRSFGVLIPHPKVALGVGLVVSSAVFMVAHFAADPWLNVYYFALGVVFSVMAFRTGGLELPVVVHTLNNVFALLVTTWTGTMDQAFERSVGAGTPLLLLGPLLGLAVLAIAELLGRRAGSWQVLTPAEPPGIAALVAPGTDVRSGATAYDPSRSWPR